MVWDNQRMSGSIPSTLRRRSGPPQALKADHKANTSHHRPTKSGRYSFLPFYLVAFFALATAVLYYRWKRPPSSSTTENNQDIVAGPIANLKLKLFFDSSKLQNELRGVLLDDSNPWAPHGNIGVYSGTWDGLALRSPSGDPTDLEVIPPRVNLTAYQDTSLLNRSRYLQQVLNNLHCWIGSVRFLRLASGAVIDEHSDPGLQYEYGEARLHIPVVTNPLVNFTLNGNQVTMLPGEVWYINAAMPHSVKNLGSTDRIHLVIDVAVNPWVMDQFAAVLHRPAPIIPGMMIATS